MHFCVYSIIDGFIANLVNQSMHARVQCKGLLFYLCVSQKLVLPNKRPVLRVRFKNGHIKYNTGVSSMSSLPRNANVVIKYKSEN